MRGSIRKRVFAAAILLLCLAVATQDAWAKGRGGGGGKGGRGGGKAHAGARTTTHGGGKATGGQRTIRPQGKSQALDRQRAAGRQSVVEHGHDAVRGPSDRAGSLERGSKTGRAGQTVQNRDRFSTRKVASDSPTSHPWSMQRVNEQRKLDHRLGVADKLDQLAEKNPNLRDVAARKREKAWEHYDKRMAKINGQDPNYVPSDGSDLIGDGPGLDDAVEPLPPVAENPLADMTGGTGDVAHSISDATDGLSGVTSELPGPSGPGPLTDNPIPGQKLTGRENALYRQIRNEQRQLAKRMETADRIWDEFERTGDERLADAARALEERAVAQFENRMDAISDFQQRHGLPDIKNQQFDNHGW